MTNAFERSGALTELDSYPAWLRDVVHVTSADRRLVSGHEVFAKIREASLSHAGFQAFLRNGWPVVEQFPQYMAMNLLKLRADASLGMELARRYLTRNIRVEQNHAIYWRDWSAAHDLGHRDLDPTGLTPAALALSHWCWKSSSVDALAASVAATNYAIEGVTGEWSAFVCSSTAYEESLPEAIRKKATRWLRLHAHYDDAHPWEALEIIATLLGHSPSRHDIEAVRNSIRLSYQYFRMSLDEVSTIARARGADRFREPALQSD